MTIFIHALIRSFNTKINIIVLFLSPILIVFLPGQFGLLFFGLVNIYSAFLLSRPVIDDRSNKTIIRIAATPTSYFNYLSSHLLAYALILTFQSILFIIANIIYWKGNLLDYMFVLTLYLAYTLMTISFSLFWNSLFKHFNLSSSLFSGVATLMCLFSGVSIPLQLFPESFRKVVIIFPTHWLPYGLEALHNDKIIRVLMAHLFLIIFSGIFILLGSKRRY